MRIFVLDVQTLLTVVVPVDLCVNMQLVDVPAVWSVSMLFALNRLSLKSMAKNQSCPPEPVYSACEIRTWSGRLFKNIGVTSVAIARAVTVARNNVMILQPVIMYSVLVPMLLEIKHVIAFRVCFNR